jgi:hypothetical protein
MESGLDNKTKLFAAPSGADDKNAEVSANPVLGYFFALFPLSYL